MSSPGQYKTGCVNSCVATCLHEADNSNGNSRSRFGAVYVAGRTQPFYGFSFAWRTSSDAMDEAAAQCRDQSGGLRCRRLLVFDNKCASIVFGRRDNNEVVDIAGAAEPSQRAASAGALALCRGTSSAPQCRVEKEFCSNDAP